MIIGLIIFGAAVVAFEVLALRKGVDTRDSHDWILDTKHGI